MGRRAGVTEQVPLAGQGRFEGRRGGQFVDWRTSSRGIPNILQPAAALSGWAPPELRPWPHPLGPHPAACTLQAMGGGGENDPKQRPTAESRTVHEGKTRLTAAVKETGRCEIVCVHVNSTNRSTKTSLRLTQVNSRRCNSAFLWAQRSGLRCFQPACGCKTPNFKRQIMTTDKHAGSQRRCGWMRSTAFDDALFKTVSVAPLQHC